MMLGSTTSGGEYAHLQTKQSMEFVALDGPDVLDARQDEYDATDSKEVGWLCRDRRSGAGRVPDLPGAVLMGVHWAP